MTTRTVPIVVQGGGGSSAAGILLLLVAIVGLVALFSGNLDRFIEAIGGPAGGAEGLSAPSRGNWTPDQPRPGSWGEVTPPGTGAAGQPSRPTEGPF